MSGEGALMHGFSYLRLAAFLAGPSGDAITGQALSICGGATAFGG